jgi:hypothetical protein
MTLWMTVSVKVERLLRGAGISTQDNDDLAKTLRASQTVITWHDGGDGNKNPEGLRLGRSEDLVSEPGI